MCYMRNARYFIRNHFIRNPHVEGHKIQGACTIKDKISKELFNFEYFLSLQTIDN